MNLAELKTTYSDELSYIDALFQKEGISFSEEELLIDIDSAWKAIAKYLFIDETTYQPIYSTLVVRLAMAYFNNNQLTKGNLKGDLQITQQTQGSRSVTYRSNLIELDSNGLTAEVKAALPVRKLRVV